MTPRPTIITILCVLGFIGFPTSILLLFISPVIQQFPSWYPFLVVISAIVGFVSVVGLWKMKKWGFILYLAMFIAVNIVTLSTGLWTIGGLIMPLIFIILISFQYKKLS